MSIKSICKKTFIKCLTAFENQYENVDFFSKNCPDEIEKYYIKKLNRLVSFANKKSDFYSEYFGENLRDSGLYFRSLNEFSRLPMLEKKHLASGGVESLKIRESKGFIRETTGTTGVPIRVYVNSDVLGRQLRVRNEFLRWHGIGPGASEGRFWGRSKDLSVNNKIKDFLLNRKVFQLDRRDESHFKNELFLLQSLAPDYFYGYASLLLKAAEVYDEISQHLRPRPKLIVSTAEMMSEVQRKFISSVFSCPVVQEYGCSEVDIIAFECPFERYHLNLSRLYVEFVYTDSYHGEVVLTDLDNFCSPIIRYNIGDTVELTDRPCECGRGGATIKKVSGRTIKRIVPLPSGGFFHAVKFAHIVEKLCNEGYKIRKYKVEHIDLVNVVFKVTMSGGECSKNRLVKRLGDELLNLFGEKVNVEIDICDIDSQGKYSYYEKKFE